MAKIKNFRLITAFVLKMYCNLRKLNTRVLILPKIILFKYP